MMHGLVSGQVKKESENVLELASHFKMFFFCPELERRSLELCRSNNNSSSSNKFSRLKFSNQTPKKICRRSFTFDKVGGLFGMSQQEFQLPSTLKNIARRRTFEIRVTWIYKIFAKVSNQSFLDKSLFILKV